MADPLKDFSRPNRLIEYVDDLLLFSAEGEKRGTLLDKLLRLLRETGFNVNPKKAQIGREEVKFLGLTVRAGERAIDEAKRKAVQELPAPMDVTGIKSFLGLTGYCRDFLEGYAATAAPLLRLLRKGIGWEWDQNSQEAFTRLKENLQMAPALGTINSSEEFFLEVAASGDSWLCCSRSGMASYDPWSTPQGFSLR
ncbi:uncharacterized protein [Heptranchias perlo]|uniref:uncharacterized protein n=1 Tax=Heptranchias perlo TaxID=212740 RepID=UPI00355A3616